jgi:hypothetical protein
MKRNPTLFKIQLSLLVIVLTIFGIEMNLSQVNCQKCQSMEKYVVQKMPTYLYHFECATHQTINFVKVITQLFDKQGDRP